MKIQDLLQSNAMILSLSATDKAGAISEMVQKLVDTGYVTDFEQFKAGILAREALTSTGLGDGIAMPHSKNTAVKEAVVLFAKKEGGLEDRKSTRLNSSHHSISYAVFCLKKKKK